MSERGARRTLVLIVALSLALGVGFSVINPIFESPDESLNYANIRYLIEERRLPELEPDEPTKAHHPPAYYTLGALLTSWVPNQNFEAITEQVNAFWIHRVDEPGIDNKTLYLHDPALERFPYRDVTLGVHLVRWMSLLMGVGTLLCIYRTMLELAPRRPALASMTTALVAFNPMFLYISASVHDDALANLVAAAILLVTARLLNRGATTRRAMALGGLMGLALLTKLTCLLIAPTVGLALLARSVDTDDHVRWGRFLRLVGAIALVALLVGGWWLVRNQLLYGEPTSMGRQVEAWGGFRANAPDVRAALRELGFLHDSFWGAFGYGQIPMPDWAYVLPRLLGLMSAGGWLISWARGRYQQGPPNRASGATLSRRTLVVLFSAPLVALTVVFLRMVFIDTANFGRYLFVSLGFLAPLYTLGLDQWWKGRSATWTAAGVSIGMLALAVFALVGVVRPVYARPEMLSFRDVQARAEWNNLQFGDSIRLIGQDVSRRRARPGEELEVTLCWESLGTMEENYVYFVHLLGREERVVAARSTHPGLGRYPTSRWSPGDRFCDVVDMRVDEAAPAPAVYGVEIGWHEQGSEQRLPAFTPDASKLELVLLDRIKVAPERYPSVSVPRRLDADLGGEISLLGYDINEAQVSPGATIDVRLFWEAQTQPTADYTVFLHLAADEGPPHAQDDSQPRDGYYPTSFWDLGEVVSETRHISVPTDLSPGEYPLMAGMYLLETGQRLPWLGSDGTVQGDAVPIDTVTVAPGGS